MRNNATTAARLAERCENSDAADAFCEFQRNYTVIANRSIIAGQHRTARMSSIVENASLRSCPSLSFPSFVISFASDQRTSESVISDYDIGKPSRIEGFLAREREREKIRDLLAKRSD